MFLLSPPQDTFRAGRLQLISSSHCSEEMDLLLVLFRPGVACCSSSRKIKKKFSFLKNVLLPSFLPFRRKLYVQKNN
ncbi:hypothetical protein C6Y45_07230 [Alkalicoccus saliphilus]|uniref:Uncharacterized protein n=1 Tax=Alkalicoccus saliphilus TaxID=200989 RepID=A0A2T4U700_9BACI|nr:hypothetical protein C6Y45_07230 [Alkalicoccus saliphilus]